MQTYIDFQMKDDILIVGIAGDLDHHQATRIREEIDKTLDTFICKNLIFDFTMLEFMDSSGIGVVMGRYNKIKDKGGRVVIAGGSKYVHMILEMAGIFTIIDKFENILLALQSYPNIEENNSVLDIHDIKKEFMEIV